MIDILCPVLGRPERTEPFTKSLIENTTSEYRLVFLCTPGDDEKIKTCMARGGVITVPWSAQSGDFAKKINYGFDYTDNEWILVAADDLKFGANWDLAALNCARRMRRLVVGTNDLHNPSVLRGKLSTHPFFRREYIEKYGSGTRDNSGRVFCELYDHQFVDNEFCETAMERDQWSFCRNAIVEHLHPYWGLAPWDETYKKAIRKTQKDQRLYMSRSPHFKRTKQIR